MIGANLTISGFFIIAPILNFKDLQLSVLYSISTILHKLKKKVEKSCSHKKENSIFIDWQKSSSYYRKNLNIFIAWQKVVLTTEKLKQCFYSLTKKLFWIVIKVTVFL